MGSWCKNLFFFYRASQQDLENTLVDFLLPLLIAGKVQGCLFLPLSNLICTDWGEVWHWKDALCERWPEQPGITGSQGCLQHGCRRLWGWQGPWSPLPVSPSLSAAVPSACSAVTAAGLCRAAIPEQQCSPCHKVSVSSSGLWNGVSAWEISSSFLLLRDIKCVMSQEKKYLKMQIRQGMRPLGSVIGAVGLPKGKMAYCSFPSAHSRPFQVQRVSCGVLEMLQNCRLLGFGTVCIPFRESHISANRKKRRNF